MRIVLYLLTIVLGAIGAMGILRSGEVLAFGGGSQSPLVTLAIGVVFLGLAWKCLQKARQQGST